MNKKSFWKFSHSCKWDDLNEDDHLNIIYAGLNDPDTKLETNQDDTFIMYGPEEALLIQPKSLFLICNLFMFMHLIKLFKGK